jgi:hypothetical protein
MKKERRKKCLGCKKWFTPDPRSQDRQRFCSKAACKKASKVWRQAKWFSKPQNHHYWRGAEELARVRKYRIEHPGYWRRESRHKRVRSKTT